MSRRHRGDGAIYQEGDKWVARVELPIGADGKRRQRKRYRSTQRAARAALKELLADQNDGIPADIAKRTVAEAVEAFRSIQNPDRAEITIYQEDWRLDMIVQAFGAKHLRSLTVADCDAFYVRVAIGDFGTRTINTDGVGRTRSLLAGVYRNEMRLGHITQNPAELSRLPKTTIAAQSQRTGNEDGDDVPVENRRALSRDELERLWRIARQPLIVVVDLSGRNGLRPSEARALRWDCLDLEAKTLRVDRQMSSKDTLRSPKTKRSYRTIPIDDQTVGVLTAWRSIQDERRRRAGDLWRNRYGLVVTTRYGTPINRSNLNRMVSTASNEAAFETIVPYELRHTAITFQLEAGHEAWRVADWAGTSERMIEQIYRHRLSRVADIGPVEIGINTIEAALEEFDRPSSPT